MAKLAGLAWCGIATVLASAPAMAEVSSGDALDANSQIQAATAQNSQSASLIAEETIDLGDAAPTLASSAQRSESSLPQAALASDIATTTPVAYRVEQDVNRDDRGSRWLSEVRVGLLAQDQGPIVNSVESGVAYNVEVLFNSPDFLDGIGSPRPHFGVSSASDPYATSYAYAGLTWERELANDWFLVGGLGLALHDGEYLRKSEQPVEDWRRSKTLGCRVDFHWGIGAGRRLSEHWNAALHYEHVSSADVCIKGALGLENVGFRIGRVF